ncbi:MAG: DUF2063 domain-containing protein [Legionella sp.]|nr:MAG: DUF2063 domain-containing protein [Legionella sp.]
MTDLLQLQEQFQEFILHGQSQINDAIVETESVSVDVRLQIYRDAYQLRLLECLNSNFPLLCSHLGAEKFNTICADYIATHPSTYRSIRWYGDGLADFLKHHKEAYLTEFADLEWKMGLAFDAADAERISITQMAAVPIEAWPGLQFVVHPSLQRMNYCWNVFALWQALAKKEPVPELLHNAHATSWVLWRMPDYVTHFYSLGEEEAWALDAVLQGLSFGELCEGLCHWLDSEEVGMRAASFLKGWIEKGMLSRLQIQ